MSKRRYTNMLVLLPVIEKMMAAGMSHREIEDEFQSQSIEKAAQKGSKGCTKVPQKETRKDIAGIQARKQAVKDGSEVTAGFSAVYRKEVRPKVEYAVIYRHRNEYPVYRKCSTKSRLFRKMRNPKTLDLQGFSGS